MRIIAGTLKGRIIESPRGHKTHPMSEKIRGALFNMLGDIEGLTLLDAFAGSGACAFEALSRGAREALCIDQTKEAQDAMNKTSMQLNLRQRCKIVRANASSWSSNNQSRLFDLVILDPPFDDIQPDLLLKLVCHLSDDGILVLSLPGNVDEVPIFKGLTIVAQKQYGDAQLYFYKRNQEYA